MTVETSSAIRIGDNLEDWMSLLPATLQNIPIIYLAIPGSHDSASYSITPSSGIAPDALPFVRRLAKVFGPLVRHFVFNWSVTQHASVKEQLHCGVRYLDIRLGTKTGSRGPYFVHGLYGMEVERILQEVDAFLADHEGLKTMRLVLVVLHIALVGTQIWASSQYREDLEDNEFAEFEDFEEDEEESVPREAVDQQPQAQKGRKGADVQELDEEEVEEEDEDDAIVEDDESEFDHFQDEEEFEGFDSERVGSSGKLDDKEAPKITITKVPLHFRTNWDSFYLEMLMIAGLVVYALNFFTGKSKNNKLANSWLVSHRNLLEENFSLVGDDGKIENENPGLMKDSENLYTLWCSGRTCCEGMLVELKFLKRQDLVAMIGQLMRPSSDQVHIRVDMNKEDMDTFVFCVATKKSALRLAKDMADLSFYCPERRSVEKFGLPSNFSLLYEIVEVATSLLDSRIVAVINKYPDIVEYIHFSDQFSGPKQPEDSSLTKLPETKKVLMFGFNIPVKGKSIHEAMDQMRPLLQLVFYCMDKVKRFKVSKEAKAKAEKNRQRVEEAFMKTTHAARAEAAAVRREEKKRQEKERILLEDDPEKQRKWEDRELKRQMKKKAPKMKQLKVKAL